MFFFIIILNFRSKFEHLEKKYDPHSLWYYRNYGLRKTQIDKFLKCSVSEDPTTSNMGNGPEYC